MAQTPPGHDDGYFVYNSDGTSRTAYDSSGQRLYEESGSQVRTDYAREGGTTTRTDPVTGETYTYDQEPTEYDSNREGWDRRRERRGRRRSRRDRERSERDARVEYYGREATEDIGGIQDPWAALEGEIPTYEDLMGDEYTATMGEAAADPMAVAAQRAAIQRMGQVARTGYTAEDRAMEQQARSNAAQFERQQREAIMQQAATRGMQGAGTTLGAQLAAQQGGANRQSQASLDMAANAQRRALQALQMQSAASGQMRGQSFNEDTARRSAVDEANRYMIDGQRSASRDRFGMQGQVAQGQSTAAGQAADRNLAMKQDAAGQKTKGEKAGEYATGAVDTIAGFF